MTFTFDHVTPLGTTNTTYTFISEALGTPSADRIIILTVHGRINGAGSRTITAASSSINGVAVTKLVELSSGASNGCHTAILLAAVPSGSSGNIVIAWSGSMFRCTVGVYVATGLNTTAVDTDSTALDNTTLNLSYNDQGIVLGCSYSAANAAGAAWTGVTEDYDATQSADSTYSGAHSSAQSGSGTLACKVDWTTATNPSTVYASFEPTGGGGGTVQQTLPLLGVGA